MCDEPEPTPEEKAKKSAAGRRPAPPAELKPGQTRKEIEGVFMIRDGYAEFVPVKVGIAGEKYFEVLSGLKPGDEVITGPFASVRGMRAGDAVRLSTEPAVTARTKGQVMHQFLEAASLALQAIWANKLRSL